MLEVFLYLSGDWQVLCTFIQLLPLSLMLTLGNVVGKWHLL